MNLGNFENISRHISKRFVATHTDGAWGMGATCLLYLELVKGHTSNGTGASGAGVYI